MSCARRRLREKRERTRWTTDERDDVRQQRRISELVYRSIVAFGAVSFEISLRAEPDSVSSLRPTRNLYPPPPCEKRERTWRTTDERDDVRQQRRQQSELAYQSIVFGAGRDELRAKRSFRTKRHANTVESPPFGAKRYRQRGSLVVFVRSRSLLLYYLLSNGRIRETMISSRNRVRCFFFFPYAFRA